MSEKQPLLGDLMSAAVQLFSSSEVEGLERSIPYAGQALRAYHWARRRRVKLFFRALDHEIKQSPADGAKKLRAHTETEAGRQVLAEYMDAMLATSSPTVLAAIALLYADSAHERYPIDFKRYAVNGLKGLEEELVEVYFEALQHEDSGDPGRGTVWFWGSDMSRSPIAAKYLPSVASRAGAAGRLISRQLLLPSEVLGSTTGPMVVGFCYPEYSGLMKDLLERAYGVASAVGSDDGDTP